MKCLVSDSVRVYSQSLAEMFISSPMFSIASYVYFSLFTLFEPSNNELIISFTNLQSHDARGLRITFSSVESVFPIQSQCPWDLLDNGMIGIEVRDANCQSLVDIPSVT